MLEATALLGLVNVTSWGYSYPTSGSKPISTLAFWTLSWYKNPGEAISLCV